MGRLFPGWPGGPHAQNQVHDPRAHFRPTEVVAWYGFSSTSGELRVQETFVGPTGPATMFHLDVCAGYRISKLSFFGNHEADFQLEDVAL